jgi:hypothetical protein
VKAMPVASGTTVTAPISPIPAIVMASETSRFVSLASNEEPARRVANRGSKSGYQPSLLQLQAALVVRITRSTIQRRQHPKGSNLLLWAALMRYPPTCRSRGRGDSASAQLESTQLELHAPRPRRCPKNYCYP